MTEKITGSNGYKASIEDGGKIKYYDNKGNEIKAEDFVKKCPTIFKQANQKAGKIQGAKPDGGGDSTSKSNDDFKELKTKDSTNKYTACKQGKQVLFYDNKNGNWVSADTVKKNSPDFYQSALRDAGVKNAAVAAKKKTDSKAKTTKSDGTNKSARVGFWNGTKALLKGMGKSVTKMFTDENGKFSLKQTAKTVGTCVAVMGVAAAVVAAEVLTAGQVTWILVGAGVAMGGAKAIQGGMQAYNAENQDDRLAALEDCGEGVGDVGMAILTKKGVGKGLGKVELATNASRASAEAEGASAIVARGKGFVSGMKSIVPTKDDVAGAAESVKETVKHPVESVRNGAKSVRDGVNESKAAKKTSSGFSERIKNVKKSSNTQEDFALIEDEINSSNLPEATKQKLINDAQSAAKKAKPSDLSKLYENQKADGANTAQKENFQNSVKKSTSYEELEKLQKVDGVDEPTKNMVNERIKQLETAEKEQVQKMINESALKKSDVTKINKAIDNMHNSEAKNSMKTQLNNRNANMEKIGKMSKDAPVSEYTKMINDCGEDEGALNALYKKVDSSSLSTEQKIQFRKSIYTKLNKVNSEKYPKLNNGGLKTRLDNAQNQAKSAKNKLNDANNTQKQANKARNKAVDNQESATKKYNKIKGKADEAQNKTGAAASELEQRTSEYQAKRTEVNELESKQTNLEGQKSENRTQQNQNRSKLDENERNIEENEANQTKLEAEKRDIQERLENLNKREQELNSANERLENSKTPQEPRTRKSKHGMINRNKPPKQHTNLAQRMKANERIQRNNERLQEIPNDRKTLQAQQRTLDAELEQLKEQHANLKEANAKINETIEECDRAYQELEDDLAATKKDINVAKGERESLRKAHRTARRNHDKLKEKSDKLASDLEESNRALGEANNRAGEANTKLQQANEEAVTAQEAFDKANANLMKAKSLYNSRFKNVYGTTPPSNAGMYITPGAFAVTAGVEDSSDVANFFLGQGDIEDFNEIEIDINESLGEDETPIDDEGETSVDGSDETVVDGTSTGTDVGGSSGTGTSVTTPGGTVTPTDGTPVDSVTPGILPTDGITPPEGVTHPENVTPPEGVTHPENVTPPETIVSPESVMPPEIDDNNAVQGMRMLNGTDENGKKREIRPDERLELTKQIAEADSDDDIKDIYNEMRSFKKFNGRKNMRNALKQKRKLLEAQDEARTAQAENSDKLEKKENAVEKRSDKFERRMDKVDDDNKTVVDKYNRENPDNPIMPPEKTPNEQAYTPFNDQEKWDIFGGMA